MHHPRKTATDFLTLLSQPPTGARLAKRERTRRQLVTTAIRVIAENGVAQASVQQIAAAADVTTVTFYNYFHSKADVVAAVAMFIAEALREHSKPSRTALQKGAERMAAGCLRYLHLAETNPTFALLVLDVANAEPKLLDRIGEFVSSEWRLGLRQGDFTLKSEAAALDLVVGAIMRAMGRIARAGAPRGYRNVVTETVLCGLGLSRAKARTIRRRPLDELIGGIP